MRAVIKIVTAQKEFSKADLDVFRRILNVLHAHDLSAVLEIRKKSKEQISYNVKLRLV